MRIHTNLLATDIPAALAAAKAKGHVADDVTFAVLDLHGSRAYTRAFKIQLGTANQHSLKGLEEDAFDVAGKPQHTRRTRNSWRDDYHRYAAAWSEWGWFLAEIFELDPCAVCVGYYKSAGDFDAQTGGKFRA